MRFIHAADIHLGYQQYGFKQRFNGLKKPIAPHHDFLYVASLFGADIVFSRPPLKCASILKSRSR